jgi:CRISPR-associated protein (TIGR02710 family)
VSSASPRKIVAALVSVGGSPAPVLHVLRHHRPEHVWYFCSESSRPLAGEIQSQLDWKPQARFIEADKFEELGPCYRQLRRQIPEMLREARVSPEDVLVDYTGGAKAMSAALVLAATEVFQRFSYVGGTQRSKGGLGITLDGTERVVYQDNPWSALAIREVERARDLWGLLHFDAAARVLQDVAPRVPQRLRFETLALVAEGTAARHRLDFAAARDRLGKARRNLPGLFDGRDDFGLCEFVGQSLKLVEACGREQSLSRGEERPLNLFRELLDNAIRTARQDRFEDAAARLYRAMEMQGQIWLAEATNNLFWNSKCPGADFDKFSEALKALDFCRPAQGSDITLNQTETYRALAALGNERAQAIVADLEAGRADGKSSSRWRAVTEKRNTSILAHGLKAVTEKGFEEVNPIPPLNARWFD